MSARSRRRPSSSTTRTRSQKFSEGARRAARARCRGCWSSPRTIRHLKSDALFRDLQAQLEGTENRITVARNRYIKSVQEFNTTVRSFPTNLTAMLFKMDVKPNFTVENEAAISAPPKVDFSKAPAPAPATAPPAPKS